MSEWWIYQGTGKRHDGIKRLPDPPNWRNWRTFEGEIIDRPQRSETINDVDIIRHIGYKSARANAQGNPQDSELIKEIELVNAARQGHCP